MFCMKCGEQLPDGACFCMKCGTAIQGEFNVNSSSMRIVKAQCTNCNAPLEVDSTQAAAICPYCNTTYVVEKAINNYNINMNTGNMNISNAVINVSNGSNIDNLLLRAEKYEQEGNYIVALEYYNKVLDIDISQTKAQDAIHKIEKRIEEYVYYRGDANKVFSFGQLLLKKGKLIFVNKKGKETVYYLERIINPRVTMGCLGFMYEGNSNEISYATQNTKILVEMILNAKKGIYPEMKFLNEEQSELEKEIISKFDKNKKVAAIKYYRERTGADLKEAKEYIDSIL